VIFWIPYICQCVEKKHPNLVEVVDTHPKSDMHVQGSPCKKASCQGHNPYCSKFSRGCKSSQNLCPTWGLFGTSCKSFKLSPLYWGPPLILVKAMIFYYYIPLSCVIPIENK